MKKILLFAATAALLSFSTLTNAQAPTLGSTADFALFSSDGAISSTGLSHITGHVGTNNGSSTNFGNVDGVMHDADGASQAAAADLLLAYSQLDAAIPNFFPSSLLGNGQSLNPGTYAIGESASLNNTLILNGQGSSNSVFIFQIQGAFSSAANAQVLLTNGALACNVFWKIEGLVDLGTNTIMKGTVVANNSAIILNSGVALEGRALSKIGAVTIAGSTIRIPVGCGSPVLTGPVAPPLNTAACYAIFTRNGEVTNSGVSTVTGDIGSNDGPTTGFEQSNVNGTIHYGPDTSTGQCANDVSGIYTYLTNLPVDIQLLYPAAFGNDLVLTPHTYLLNAETVMTNAVYLNAQDNPDAVFVLKVVGAFSTSTAGSINLINGAQAKNVYWKIDGAVSINTDTNFKGTIIGNGAVSIGTNAQLEGRILAITGGIASFAIDAQMTPGCGELAVTTNTIAGNTVQFYPNPFTTSLNVSITDNSLNELMIYNTVGALVMKTSLVQSVTNIPTNLPSGVYFYKVINSNGLVVTGKLISQ